MNKNSPRLLVQCFPIAFTLALFFSNFYKSQTLINIDLAKNPEKKQSVSGFLHFNDLLPLEKHIKELKPKYWRVGNTLHNKEKRIQQIKILHSYDIIPILVITDFFAGIENDWPNPLKHKSKFSNLVKDLYIENGNNVVYDIWNEPNTKDKGDFFETFKIAYNSIRSQPGGENAIITGPGTSRFDQEFIKDFLDYCLKNNLRLDILNWHEGGIIDDVLQVQKNIKIAQNWVKEYSPIGIKKIYIPEILWITEQFNPAAAFSYLYIIEKNNVTGTCKTCWDTSVENGGNTCWNNSIDGLLDPKGNTRSVWWAYKLYAESLDKRLLVNNSNENLMSLAYLNSKNDLAILLANTSKEDIRNLTISFTNTYKFKDYNKLQLFEVTNTVEKPLKELKFIANKKISLKKDNNRILLKDIKYNTLYYLLISKS